MKKDKNAPRIAKGPSTYQLWKMEDKMFSESMQQLEGFLSASVKACPKAMMIVVITKMGTRYSQVGQSVSTGRFTGIADDGTVHTFAVNNIRRILVSPFGAIVSSTPANCDEEDFEFRYA